MAYADYSLLLADYWGNTARTHVPLGDAWISPSATAPQAIKSALQACIDGNIIATETSTQSGYIGAGVVGTANKPKVEDRAVITLGDANNRSHNFAIPAPVTLLQLSSNKNAVDLTQTLVTTWFGDMETYAATEADVAYDELISGIITSKKQMKR